MASRPKQREGDAVDESESHSSSSPSFNPEMLRLARGSRPFTQSELAEQLGISQSKIAKWEDGLLVPSSPDVTRLAAILEFPDDFFFQPDRVYGFGSCCMYHRKRKSVPLKTLNLIHDRINVIRMHVSRLIRRTQLEPSLELPRLDIDEYGSSPERIAQVMRATWRMPSGPIKSLIYWVEAAGGIVIQMNMGTDRINAVSMWPPNLPPLFFINSKIPADRWRFTLAHEIGHLVMHQTPTPDAEREADRFASEFLMPSREIGPELSRLSLPIAARLKHRWRVSMQALIMKAKDTGQISPAKCKSLFSYMGKLGYRKVEPEMISPETPTTIRSIIKLHTETLGYSMEKVANVSLCLTESQFRSRVLGDVFLKVVRGGIKRAENRLNDSGPL
jgi:Zn-dependent peptidase ImmA (M78 family)/DNA-binding transcriptional regulator YiaG